MTKRTILISAYACEPHQGSEPGVGWHTVKELAKYHTVWVLTTRYHRRGIEAHLETEPTPNLRFVYIDPLGWTYDWHKPGRRWNLNIHYYLWQLSAYKRARKLHEEVGFDLAHHITYVRYWTPSFLVLLNIPFVFGTVGGGEATPEAFMSGFSVPDRLFERLRTATQRASAFDPFVRLTARRSRQVVAATPETAQRLEALGARHIKVQSAEGLSETDLRQLELPGGNEERTSVRFLSVGRLLHWKGFHLGLEAFARAGLKDAEYWLIGAGPERGRLEALACELGVREQVQFFGTLPRREVLEKLAQVDALVHPSLHDSSGWVCLEAMAASRPVVCLSLGGPNVQVTGATGIKVEANTPHETVEGLKDALQLLARCPAKRRELGRAARQHILENYTWETKGQKLVELYETIWQEN